ncbi:MAG: TRC40/GET3/ArsA family transport-energizing ATPase [Bacillota bacterium]
MKTHFTFFSGKGGVGKTTMASATAIHYADAGQKTLIVTTDPASNLADVFEQEIGHHVTPIQGVPNLWAMEIDPDRATEEYRERVLAPLRAVMPQDVVNVVEEQFRSPCTTEIASFDRFVDFMDHPQFDQVIFDTAPTGHTLRLLQLPVDWSRHIEEAAQGSGRTCIGPVQAIQESKAKYDLAVSLLQSPEDTSFTFVLVPEETSLYETARSAEELGHIGIRSYNLIVNQILPEDAREIPFFRRRWEMQQQYLQEIDQEFAVPKRHMLQRDNEVKGIASLRAVGRDLFGEGSSTAPPLQRAEALTSSPNAADQPLEGTPIPSNTDTLRQVRPLLEPKGGQTRSVFFTGKGGVGKTIVSCVTALDAAARGHRTLLLTTDPAAHIGEVLEQKVEDEIVPVKGVPNLWAVMIDQGKAVVAYKEKILADARGRYSEDMLAAVQEELESPCTEEMAAFDRFSAYVDSRDFDVVVFDTAPTGHTLRLLDLPFDYSRQVEMMVTTSAESKATKSETQERFDRIIARLRDPDQTTFAFVVYPESTPVIEAYRAMLDLRDAGIGTQLVVANQVLPPEHCTNAFFRRRQQMQAKYLGEIRRRFDVPVLTLPLLDSEVRGLPALQEARRLLYGS